MPTKPKRKHRRRRLLSRKAKSYWDLHFTQSGEYSLRQWRLECRQLPGAMAEVLGRQPSEGHPLTQRECASLVAAFTPGSATYYHTYISSMENGSLGRGPSQLVRYLQFWSMVYNIEDLPGELRLTEEVDDVSSD